MSPSRGIPCISIRGEPNMATVHDLWNSLLSISTMIPFISLRLFHITKTNFNNDEEIWKNYCLLVEQQIILISRCHHGSHLSTPHPPYQELSRILQYQPQLPIWTILALLWWIVFGCTWTKKRQKSYYKAAIAS